MPRRRRPPASLRTSMTSCLAGSSPDAASVSWLIVNGLCLAFSLHLALYDLWSEDADTATTMEAVDGGDEDTYNYNDDGNNNNDNIATSASSRATVEYLVWSLVTTIIWIVEVALKTAFPFSVQERTIEIQSSNNNSSNSNNNSGNDDDASATTTDGNNDTAIPTALEHEYRIHSDGQQQPQPLHRQSSSLKQLPSYLPPKRHKGLLLLELLLASFFFIESIFDCLHWKDRVLEDDVLGEEVDIWISILGYLYMTYETYKAAMAKRQYASVLQERNKTSLLHIQQQQQPGSSPSSHYVTMTTVVNGETADDDPNTQGVLA